MLHNRLDLQPIQDPTGYYAPDEPVFILGAHCPIAAATVVHWASLAEAEGWAPEVVASVRRWAQVMADWHADRGRQGPNLEPQPLRV